MCRYNPSQGKTCVLFFVFVVVLVIATLASAPLALARARLDRVRLGFWPIPSGSPKRSCFLTKRTQLVGTVNPNPDPSHDAPFVLMNHTVVLQRPPCEW
ncbi:hypothetical protein N658DRAFT_127296 [Parathielavia hyrcaniae]|uniref:Uncharacterized protein n=1 Tax=Parathielavia hyrcaniae TaxID=113614 RepID=A0AAN6T5N3_9PEZI|nr:hypothetical protein N658DRAFT_127296 [Parathielavia hyrcaniae]